MRKDPALTYQGALQILGHRDQRWLKRIDLLLGGAILAAGAASLINPIASVAAFAAIWGWIDQKNEAIRLVQEALDGLPARLRVTAGLERRQLVIAAHSTLVVAAYVEVLREELGDKHDLDLAEKVMANLAEPGGGISVPRRGARAVGPARVRREPSVGEPVAERAGRSVTPVRDRAYQGGLARPRLH
jgi:hypothetical protein